MGVKREIWLDYLRVTACFMVMVVHGTEPFYICEEGARMATATDAFWVSAFEALCRCCVPLFVVASSYLQFPLHYSTGEFFRRRAVRVLVPMAFWTLVYALVWGEPVANLKGLLLNFNYAAGHLWFVYMLIGLYLVMPLLSPWAEKVSRRELEVYLGIWLFTTLIPFIREWAGGEAPLIQAADGLPAQALFPLWGEAAWNPFGLFYYVSGFVGYLLVGLYLRRFLSNNRCIFPRRGTLSHSPVRSLQPSSGKTRWPSAAFPWSSPRWASPWPSGLVILSVAKNLLSIGTSSFPSPRPVTACTSCTCWSWRPSPPFIAAGWVWVLTASWAPGPPLWRFSLQPSPPLW